MVIKNIVKKFALFALLMFSVLILLEILLRLYFAIKIGPDVFFYGTRFYKSVITIEDRALNYAEKERNVVLHENQNNNYSKYYPHQTRFDKDVNGKRFIVTINNKGFRGIDIETRKARNVLRIVCLGASSTFGYGNRDQETYPYYLQTILNADKDKIDLTRFNSIEVINLGIPHLDSKAI